jgi:hypothetical protein
LPDAVLLADGTTCAKAMSMAQKWCLLFAEDFPGQGDLVSVRTIVGNKITGCIWSEI